MDTFAQGFSPKLTQFALNFRPQISDLTFEQIKQLALLANYEFICPDHDPKLSLLYEYIGGPGIKGGISITWTIQAHFEHLIYRPQVTPIGISVHHPSLEMIEHLSSLLPQLGYKDQIMIKLPEIVITIPEEYRFNETVWVMYLSEFKTKYKPLSIFLRTFL